MKFGKPLAVRGGSAGAGTDLVQDATVEPPTVWRLQAADGDGFRILTATGELAVEAAGDAVQLRPRRAAGADSQVWTFLLVGNACHIVSKRDGRVFDVENDFADDGTRVIVYGRKDPSAAENQLWVLTEVGK